MKKTSEKLVDSVSSYEEMLMKEMRTFRRKYSKNQRAYIRFLESHYLCAQLNWAICLDELIPLRNKRRK